MNNNDWEIIVNHRSDLLTQDLVFRGIHQYASMKELGYSFDFPHIRYEHATGDIFWKAHQMKELADNLLPVEAYEDVISKLNKLLGNYRDYLSRFEKIISFKTVKITDVQEFFDRSMQSASSIARFQLELGISQELDRKNIPAQSIRSAVTETTKAHRELARIAKDLGTNIEDQALIDALRHFCERFGYLGMKYFLGHPWTVWEAYEMLKTETATAEQMIVDKPEYPSPYVRLIEELMRLRTEKWETMCYGTSLFRRMIITHFEDIVDYEDLPHLRVSEALSLLKNQFPSRELFTQREQFVLELTDEGVSMQEVMTAPILEASPGMTQEVRGRTAYPGKVRGKVKVVLTPRECLKVKEGDILVATMSTPDFLLGMARAAAFVTDIGGITSHAAIVAREMKKPCIIGTKIATQIFKDGDEVEVDANNGVVKLL
ncbi:MAG: PEP-utilizing enzyme [Candidatus Andersenbacteria bacterium]